MSKAVVCKSQRKASGRQKRIGEGRAERKKDRTERRIDRRKDWRNEGKENKDG